MKIIFRLYNHVNVSVREKKGREKNVIGHVIKRQERNRDMLKVSIQKWCEKITYEMKRLGDGRTYMGS